MAGSTFGTVFKVTTWGESHGTALGAVIDGCPPGIDLTPEMIQAELERRRPGKGGATSPRNEPDMVQIMSGIFQPEGCWQLSRRRLGHGASGPLPRMAAESL